MLTGSPPHVGASAQQIIMKIVTEEAAPVTALRKSVPPNVAAAVAKSLEKLPADRFDSAKAFASALVTPGFTTSTSAVGAESADHGSGFDRRVVGLTIALIAVTAVAAWALFRPQPTSPVARYNIVLPAEASIGGVFLRIAITPDGSGIVYSSGTGSQSALWLRERGQLAPTRIVGSDGAQAPFISPDGNRVGFYVNGELRAVSLRGGPATPLADSLVGGAGASWGVDGFIYSDAPTQAPLVRVSASGGSAPEYFTTLDTTAGEQDHLAPDVLPNGRGVVFIARRGARGESDVAVARTSTGDHRLLIPGVYARYARSGHLLWVTVDGTLMAAPFDQGALEFTGESVALVENITPRILTLPDLAISNDGTLLYTSAGGAQGGGTPVWVERTGRAQPVAGNWTASALGVALAPDGTRLAVAIEDEGEQHVWIRELERNMAPSKLTFAGGVNERPTWTSDGSSVVFVSDRLGDFDLFMRRADGTAEATLVLDRDGVGVMQGRITPDGEWLLYREGGGAAADVLARRLSGGSVDTVSIPLATSAFQETTPVVSPDGRWLAFTSDETGRLEIYIRPFPDVTSGKWLASVSGGTEPLWSKDGRELFYRNGAGDMVAAEVLPSGAPPIGEQRILFSASEYLTDVFYQRYDVTPDGQRFVMIRPGGEGIGELQFVVVENFFEELKEKVGN
jgi:serine/threonine-protein kinase